MEYLLLVRHAQPISCKDLPASKWELSKEGFNATEEIVGHISKYKPRHIFTSKEPKAISTATIIGSKLQLPVKEKPDIHEHDRSDVKIFPTKEMFCEKVTELFHNPNKLVFGQETANEALERFIKAVDGILEENAGTCVIVSHGTVMTLYTSYYNQINPIELWKSLTLPCLIVLEKDSKKFIKIIPIK